MSWSRSRRQQKANVRGVRHPAFPSYQVPTVGCLQALGLVAKDECFAWDCFRHSLNTWANETTKDITVSQTMLRHAKPDTTAICTHGNFGKASDA
jgi:hypothetical protein